MLNNKCERLLGLAARARGVVCGEGAVSDSIRNGRARLVIISSDASQNTKKKLCDKCGYYGVSIAELGDRYTLGACVGRSFAVSAAVTNAELAKAIEKQYQIECEKKETALPENGEPQN